MKSPTALPTRPVATASLQCRAQLLSLNKERPRTLAKTRPQAGWNRDRNLMGPPAALADRDGFKHPLKRQDLDSSGGATGHVGRRRKTQILKRSSFSLNVGTDTLYA